MLRALIVDDEVFTCQGIQNTFDWNSMGISEVRTAYNGVTALQIAAAFRPDIVLTDVSMPKMNGIELSRRLSELLPECKVIFITGYCETEYLRRAIKNGVVDYILKPINREELLSTVNKVIASINHDQTIHHRIAQLEQMYQKNLPLLRNNFLNALMDGQLSDPDNLLEQLKSLDMPLIPTDQYIVFCIRVDEYIDQAQYTDDDVSPHLLSIAIPELLTQLTWRKYSGFCWERSTKQFTLLLRFPAECDSIDEIVPELAETIQQSINHAIGIYVTIGIGEWVDALAKVHCSYEQAAHATDQSFYIGKNKIVYYQRYIAIHRDENCISVQDYKSVANCIRCADFDGAIAEIERAFSGFAAYSGDDPIHAIGICLQLFTSITQVAIELFISAESDLADVADTLKAIVVSRSLPEIKTLIISYCIRLEENLRGEANQKSRLTQQIRQIVEQEYTANLTIAGIASRVFLSPAYICLLFKQETGQTINQYITDTRIAAAQKLLAETDKKLLDICMEVGYSDPKYFSKLFKRKTGINPSDYRARIH